MKEINIKNFVLPIDVVKKIDFTKNVQLHEKVQDKPSVWRIGQAYVNYAYALYPLETSALYGTDCDCFYDDNKIPDFLEKLNENLLKFKKIDKNMASTIEFEGKTFTVNGKSDEQFVNEKIINLRKMRDDYQNEIDHVSRNLKYLQDKKDNIQNEIDEEFLRQEHAYDLIGKYILYKDSIYHVNEVERLFIGVRIKSNICVRLCVSKELWINPYRKCEVTISFEDLDILLNNNTETCKILTEEEFKTIVKELIDKTI